MIVRILKSSSKIPTLSLALIADSSDKGSMPKREGDRGSMPEREKVEEKIEASKSRRIPVVKFILLFAAIIIAVICLEYFI